jgi:hypothetical protein
MSLEHLWILPVVNNLKPGGINFDGLAGDVLLRGFQVTLKGLKGNRIIQSITEVLNQQLQNYLGYPTELIVSFFKNPIHKKVAPNLNSLTKEVKTIGVHENVFTIFLIKNRTKNSISLMPNNLIGKRIFSLFPFLDKDLLEFCLTIPPELKVKNRIYTHILSAMFPEIMKIPATTFLSINSIERWSKKYLPLLPLSLISWIIKFRYYSDKKDIQYLLGLLRKLTVPEFIEINKLIKNTNDCLLSGRNPLPFLVPIVEFVIWYNLCFLNKKLDSVR